MLQRLASDAALDGLNRLLRRERAAREMLLPHAGRVARIEAGPLALQFAISQDGQVEHSEAEPHARMLVDARALPAGLPDPAAMLRAAKVEGDAALAQALSDAAARLRPDVEEELSRLVGDAVAVRIVSGARAVQREAADAGQRAVRQLADWLAGERAWLASRGPFERFAAEVNELAQAAQRLAERTERLR